MNRSASTCLVVAMIAWTAACSEPNRAPFSCGPTPPQTVDIGDSISFMPCFTDPDADPLTISAEVAHHQQAFATASVSGETVTIHGKDEHAPLPVTVTATDPTGLYAVEEVQVTVRGRHDLAVLDAWPDSQTVQDDRFELHFEIGNVGSTHARLSTWSVRVSSDSVITVADSVLDGDFHVHLHNMAPSDTIYLWVPYRELADPGKPYFGLCGVSHTAEYHLANNCSKGLKVIFSDATRSLIEINYGGLRYPSSSSSHEVIVRRYP